MIHVQEDTEVIARSLAPKRRIEEIHFRTEDDQLWEVKVWLLLTRNSGCEAKRLKSFRSAVTSERLASYAAEIPKTCSARKDMLESEGYWSSVHGSWFKYSSRWDKDGVMGTKSASFCQLAYRFGKSLLRPALSPPATLHTAVRWILVYPVIFYRVTQGDCPRQGP